MSPCTIHGSIQGRIVGTKDDQIYSGEHNQIISIVIEHRYCGCVTWRQA